MKVIAYLMIFGGGFICACNMTRLIEVNPAYDTNWIKVVISVLIAVVGIIITYSHNRTGPINI